MENANHEIINTRLADVTANLNKAIATGNENDVAIYKAVLKREKAYARMCGMNV
jgi:hypothetical protein